MIQYLLIPVLILNNVDSQTANMTEEELSRVWVNKTFIESNTNISTMEPVNSTSSLYREEKTWIEDKLKHNQTSVITEDDENFQDQEIVNTGRHCLEDWLEIYSHSYCGLIFQMEMMKISTEDRCVLANIIRPYNNLTLCLEDLSNGFSCYYPNPTIQELFLTIHSKFFINCTTEKIPFEDAPQGLVIALTLIPVSIIPVLVYLVVFKSKV
ncbi:receptor activity-modifying protein 2-like isoform X2 [Eleginops maclovinus]|uniref:receptor activity-modifying protein 2-like isoform X2 n=1 Tax=Eleginops maclovinus TaxID=56733 RepID=UPI00307FE73E